MTIDVSGNMPYLEDYTLLCTSDGYDPTYSWIDTTTGDPVMSPNPLVLEGGPFTFGCVASVDELDCSLTECISGVAYSTYRKQYNTLVTIL